MTDKHLWEVDHDYYGPEGCFYSADAWLHTTFESWQDYLEDGNADSIMGLNLLYRWDWVDWRNHSDEMLRDDVDDTLSLFWMQPRKGIPHSYEIRVQKTDEPEVRAFLEKHARYMADLWAPLSLERTAVAA